MGEQDPEGIGRGGHGGEGSRQGIRRRVPAFRAEIQGALKQVVVRRQQKWVVLLFPDASKPTVTVNLTYLVGSVDENYGETGMAHLLEHLLFKGTPTHGDIPGE
ncbi:MAG TPA: insulinase family protein, partial [Candidatus Hydrogenedentes bacterium]|nr:insulinase family protein [Candidatus Hydrogenedentota bacterium]